jgi:hypothetical protein
MQETPVETEQNLRELFPEKYFDHIPTLIDDERKPIEFTDEEVEKVLSKVKLLLRSRAKFAMCILYEFDDGNKSDVSLFAQGGTEVHMARAVMLKLSDKDKFLLGLMM